MKKITMATIAATASLALAACGNSTDASEDAMADTVELPADEAMEEMPLPAEDVDVVEEAAVEAVEEDVAVSEEVVDGAVEAAEAAQATVDDVEAAIADIEATIE